MNGEGRGIVIRLCGVTGIEIGKEGWGYVWYRVRLKKQREILKAE